MGLFDRLATGWNVAMQSWGVLRKDKEMILFPVLSGAACLLLLASFAAPIALVPNLRETTQQLLDDRAKQSSGSVTQVIAGLVVFAFYVLNYFIIVYFNTALCACAIYRFRGGDPTLSTGLQLANKRLPQIFAWSILAATVGMILQAIQNRSEWLGRMVAGILGAVWSIATFLIVPVLAVEGLGPFEALKRSGQLISEVWGEGLAGNVSIGLIGFLLFLPALAILFAAALLHLPAAVLVAVVIAVVLYALAISVMTSAAKEVFIAALYVYATEKKTPAGFEDDLMQHAFVPKRR